MIQHLKQTMNQETNSKWMSVSIIVGMMMTILGMLLFFGAFLIQHAIWSARHHHHIRASAVSMPDHIVGFVLTLVPCLILGLVLCLLASWERSKNRRLLLIKYVKAVIGIIICTFFLLVGVGLATIEYPTRKDVQHYANITFLHRKIYLTCRDSNEAFDIDCIKKKFSESGYTLTKNDNGHAIALLKMSEKHQNISVESTRGNGPAAFKIGFQQAEYSRLSSMKDSLGIESVETYFVEESRSSK